MALTVPQLQALKADIALTAAWVAILNDTNPDVRVNGADTIAAAYNALASPAFTVWKTTTSVDEITDNILWDRMTPAMAPDVTSLWANRCLQAQSKQFNLQTLLLSRSSVASGRANVRAAFQDCLQQLPTKADGTNQPAGWTAVQTVMQRLATRIEKLFATGTGTPASPADLVVEEEINGSTVLTAWESA